MLRTLSALRACGLAIVIAETLREYYDASDRNNDSDEAQQLWLKLYRLHEAWRYHGMAARRYAEPHQSER